MSKHLGPNVWCGCAAARSICVQDRKIVILYVYLRNFTKKSQFYRAAMQIENFKMVFFCLQRKTIHAPSYAYLRTSLSQVMQQGVLGIVFS